MVRIDAITKEWREAGSLPAQLNLYGFWDDHAFLTKSGDLGSVLKIGGIDYESLDYAGRDYAVKRLEAALRSLDDRCRLYQVLLRHNRPAIPHAEYTNPLVRAAVEQRAAFLESKAHRLYSIEIVWVVMIDGSYAKPVLREVLSLTHTLEIVTHNFGVALLPRSASRLSYTGVLFKPITDKLLWIETALFLRRDWRDDRIRWLLDSMLSHLRNASLDHI
jgi:DNA-binding transcriptional LysR family regulator